MKKKNITYLFLAAALGVSFTSCDEVFEPAIENNLGVDYMYTNAGYAEGVLGNAYTRIPCGSFPFSEVATDDAVSNDASNSWRKIAEGQWTSNNDPAERWRNSRAAILYINLFLSRADKVHWADDPVAAELYKDRETGEAYGLRAMFMYYLLQAHAGKDQNGNLLGIPIVTSEEDANSNFNLPRNTFKECMDAIYADCDKALALLPTKYVDVEDDAKVPAKYQGKATAQQYTRVFGVKFNGRMDGAIVEAFRSKAALLAASPAFNDQSGTNYEQAANYAAEVLDRINGVSGMDPKGWTWYANTSVIDGLTNGSNEAEVLWRGEKSLGNDWESDNLPPTLYGKGRINPTQNFVDAFPMANGEPITATNSGYDAKNPYANRDPRLAAYVLYNGQKAGTTNEVINTQADGTSTNALNNSEGKSTRTGYYMRKLLRQDVNMNPSNTTTQNHYTPRIRFTEIYLNYAEAANEAWGPKGTGSHAYSAYDIIKAIRNRAGVGTGAEGDKYLEECAADKDKMRELIRNERRIELSFEGFRFWDLRRWNATITGDVNGMSITNDALGNTIYTPIKVSTLSYKDYMIYGPIPYTECLKFSELQQNKGW